MDHPGVWVGETKLGSIGVHISRGVTVQGLSLNLSVDPKLFGALVSCGVQGLTIRSVADLVPEVPPVEVAARRWAELWAQQTAADLRWVDPPT
jgi:lipoate-protein ligase B